MFLSLLDWLLKPFLCALLLSLFFLSLQDGPDCRGAAERAHAGRAGHLHQGHSRGQAGKQDCVSVSCLQDTPKGTHVRVDLQPEDQRDAGQVDFSWSGLAAADLTGRCMFSQVHTSTTHIHVYLYTCTHTQNLCYVTFWSLLPNLESIQGQIKLLNIFHISHRGSF